MQYQKLIWYMNIYIYIYIHNIRIYIYIYIIYVYIYNIYIIIYIYNILIYFVQSKSSLVSPSISVLLPKNLPGEIWRSESLRRKSPVSPWNSDQTIMALWSIDVPFVEFQRTCGLHLKLISTCSWCNLQTLKLLYPSNRQKSTSPTHPELNLCSPLSGAKRREWGFFPLQLVIPFPHSLLSTSKSYQPFSPWISQMPAVFMGCRETQHSTHMQAPGDWS